MGRHTADEARSKDRGTSRSIDILEKPWLSYIIRKEILLDGGEVGIVQQAFSSIRI